MRKLFSRLSLKVGAVLALSFLVGCGGNSGDRSGPSFTGPGNGGGSGSNSSPAPTQTTFIYGTAGEAVVGVRLGSSGQLTALNMPMDPISGNLGWLPGTGGLITSLAPDPKGRFLYALSVATSSFGMPIGKNGLSAFTIDRSSGELMQVSGSPYDVPSRGGNIAVTGDGQRLVLDSNSTITVFTINQTTGALSQVSSTSGEGNQLTTSWDGQFLFAGSGNGRTASYKIASGGSISEVNHVDVQNPGRLFLSRSGHFLYSSGQEGVSVLSVSATGQLSIALGNSAGWQRVASSRDDRIVYLSRDATEITVGAIQAFRSDPNTGAIGAQIGAPVTFANGDFPYQIETDYSHEFLIVVLASGSLLSYPISQDGTLGTPMTVQGQFVGPQFFAQAP